MSSAVAFVLAVALMSSDPVSWSEKLQIGPCAEVGRGVAPWQAREVTDLAISAAAQRLVYRRALSHAHGPLERELMYVDLAAGKTVARRHVNSLDGNRIAISLDGSLIIYLDTCAECASTELQEVHAWVPEDGFSAETDRLLATAMTRMNLVGPLDAVSISPDRGKVAVLGRRGDAIDGTEAKTAIGVIDVASGATTVIDVPGTVSASEWRHSLTWSDDGVTLYGYAHRAPTPKSVSGSRKSGAWLLEWDAAVIYTISLADRRATTQLGLPRGAVGVTGGGDVIVQESSGDRVAIKRVPLDDLESKRLDWRVMGTLPGVDRGTQLVAGVFEGPWIDYAAVQRNPGGGPPCTVVLGAQK